MFLRKNANFSNLDLSLISEKKLFWKNILSHFVNNPERSYKITWNDESVNTITEAKNTSETLNFWKFVLDYR